EIDNKDYITRLLEKLILEINTRSNLVIRVNESSFENITDIIGIVENKLGVLTNVRVEKHLDMDKPGIILESENGIIEGSIEAQFSSLDRIFESVLKTHET